MRKKNGLHTVLIATLGKSPQVLCETVWALANQANPIIPDEIVAISMENFSGDAIDSIFGKGNGWKSLLANLKKLDAPISGKLSFHEVVIAADEKGVIRDLRTPSDNSRCADYLFQVVRRYTVSPNSSRVIVSLSGGRKSLSSLVTATMSLLARPQDTMIHLIADDKLEDGGYHFPRGGRGYSLFEVPFVRTRGLIQGVDIGRVQSFAECMRLTQERLSGVEEYPDITLNSSDASISVAGYEQQAVRDIDGSRFLLLWLLFKMKSFDSDRFMKIMCKAHSLIGVKGAASWFKRFQNKVDKFLDPATIECARTFSKVKSETMRDVLRRCGLTDMQGNALYPRMKNGKPVPFEFGIAYPKERLHIVETEFTRHLEEMLLEDLS